MLKVVLLIALVIVSNMALPMEDSVEESDGSVDGNDPKNIKYSQYHNTYGFERVKNAMDFTGKVILVTGSNSGIGAETVRLFSYLGAQVVVTGRNKSRIIQVASDCYQLSPYKLKPLEVEQDLTIKGGPARLLDLTIERYGKLDALVNDAGIMFPASLINANYTMSYHEVMAINNIAILHLTQLAVPYLNQTNGTIINLASDVVGKPTKEHSQYSMSKAAVVDFSKSFSLELGPNIRVNSVSPGLILDTLIFRFIQTPYAQLPEAYKEKMKSKVPLGRLGYPIDVAKVIAFLASPLADFVTGSNQKVDGGFYGDYNF